MKLNKSETGDRPQSPNPGTEKVVQLESLLITYELRVE